MPRYRVFVKVTNLPLKLSGKKTRLGGAYTGRVVEAASVAEAKTLLTRQLTEELRAHPGIRFDDSDPPTFRYSDIAVAADGDSDIGWAFYGA